MGGKVTALGTLWLTAFVSVCIIPDFHVRYDFMRDASLRYAALRNASALYLFA